MQRPKPGFVPINDESNKASEMKYLTPFSSWWPQQSGYLSLITLIAMLTGNSLISLAAPYTLVEVPSRQRFTPNVAPVVTQEQRGVAWLNNQQVIFKGNTSAGYPERRDHGIFIWDVGKKQVTRYGDESRFCYADGILLVIEDSREDPTLRSKSEIAFRYGQLGNEKVSVCERKENFLYGCLGPLNMSCKPAEFRRTDKPLGPGSRIEFQLRQGDGIVISRSTNASVARGGKSQQDNIALGRQPLLLISKQYHEGKALPIQEVEEIGMRNAAYSEYAKRYVFVGAKPKDSPPRRFDNWPEDQPQPVYLMQSNGDVETIMVPKLKDWTSIFQALPTRAGLAYWGAHGRTGGGLFLFEGTTTSLIDRGQIGTFAVSPDGCKIAFAIIVDYGKSRVLEYRLKYVDVCK